MPRCAKCKDAEGTQEWIDLEVAYSLAISHCATTLRCELCALKEQLSHAQELADRIPHLERKILETELRLMR